MAVPKATGRPRDPAIDAYVLDATRALLEEVGFARTTISEISKRSGVHPPAIYRRWPSRTALIVDAAFADLATVDVTPSGDLRRDLRRFLRAYEASFATPAAQAAIPGLLAVFQDVAPSVDGWLHLSVRPQFEAILRAAGDQVDPAISVDDVFDIILCCVIGRRTIPPVIQRARSVNHTADLVVRLLRPDAST